MNKIIELPSDPDMIVALQKKLKEYTDRYERKQDIFPDEYPQVFLHWYSMMILEYVLEMGRVTEEEVEDMITAFTDGLLVRPDLFARALGVISDYVSTGGKKVRGGTGLQPQPE